MHRTCPGLVVGVDDEGIDLEAMFPRVQHRLRAVGGAERRVRRRLHGVVEALPRRQGQRHQLLLERDHLRGRLRRQGHQRHRRRRLARRQRRARNLANAHRPPTRRGRSGSACPTARRCPAPRRTPGRARRPPLATDATAACRASHGRSGRPPSPSAPAADARAPASAARHRRAASRRSTPPRCPAEATRPGSSCRATAAWLSSACRPATPPTPCAR